MTKPAYSVVEKKSTEYKIILPSGMVLAIVQYDGTPQEDVEFLKRILRLACEEGEMK
jgi:hypothetical protein